MYAGPWMGEFAYEIRFAARLRYLVSTGVKLIPCSRSTSAALYADFVQDFIAHNIECDGACWSPGKRPAPDPKVVGLWTPNGASIIRPCNVNEHTSATFITYGTVQSEWRDCIALHARNRLHGQERNWPTAFWEELVSKMTAAGLGPFLCIGLSKHARLVDGAIDMRDTELDTQMNVLASAKLVVGESSGPMHLACYCGAKRLVVWCGGVERHITAERYLGSWNPFKTPVIAMAKHGWRPSVDAVYGAITKALAAATAPVVERQRVERVDAAPRPSRGPGRFRPALVNVAENGNIGIGVLAYGGIDDVKRNMPTIVEHAGSNPVLLFDNSEDDAIGNWLKANCPTAEYVKSHDGNVGCSNGRNRIAELLGAKGCKRIIIQDQDVAWRGDVPKAMSAVFDAHPKTGVVSWPLALKQMGRHKIAADGLVDPPEAPGMCCMYDVQAIIDAGGWNADMFMYRFDSLFCLTAHYVGGYDVRVVNGCDLVVHNHPHEGVRRYRWWKQEQQRSQRIFLTECARLHIPVPSHLRG